MRNYSRRSTKGKADCVIKQIVSLLPKKKSELDIRGIGRKKLGSFLVGKRKRNLPRGGVQKIELPW